jgi:hypothetical protein
VPYEYGVVEAERDLWDLHVFQSCPDEVLRSVMQCFELAVVMTKNSAELY